MEKEKTSCVTEQHVIAFNEGEGNTNLCAT